MVYRGGLENRFGLTPDGGSNPSLSASFRLGESGKTENSLMNIYTIVIWTVVVLAAFIIAWRGGYIAKLSAYMQATRDELKKCAWPTWEELKGSTLVVGISIALLGGLKVALDTVFRLVMQTII